MKEKYYFMWQAFKLLLNKYKEENKTIYIETIFDYMNRVEEVFNDGK